MFAGKLRPAACAVVAAAMLASCTSDPGTGAGSPGPGTGSVGSTRSSADHRALTDPLPRILSTPRSRPNIVFVLTDDLSMNLLQFMPNVRRMQQLGTTLSRYYVVDSLCCPSRAAIFTGQYPHNNGVFTNHGRDGGYTTFQRRGDQQRTFAVALQRSGYRTGFMGKYLNEYQPGFPEPPGWDEWVAAGDGYPEYDYDLDVNGRIVHHGSRPSDYLTDVLAGHAEQFIRTSRQPFALEVATFSPHSPYTPAPRDLGTTARLAYPRTPAYDALPSAPPAWLAGRPALSAARKAGLLRIYRKRAAAVASVDDLVGRLRRTLQATGKADNTYVVFSSDNGYHLGEYRLTAGKQTPYDTDIHVPLVVTGPGVPADYVSEQLASNIDLAPTFGSLAGARPAGRVDGVDLSPLWHGRRPASWQRAVLVEHHRPAPSADDPDEQGAASAYPPDYTAVRTADALLVSYGGDRYEYYDTRSDPDELRNLAAAGVPAALRRQLAELSRCRGTAACQRAAR